MPELAKLGLRVHASGQVLASALDIRLAPAPRSLDAQRLFDEVRADIVRVALSHSNVGGNEQ